MTMKYKRTQQWKILSNDNREWWLENQYREKGRIIIDETIKSILESIDSSTPEEILQKNNSVIAAALKNETTATPTISTKEFLNQALKIFARAGVITPENELEQTVGRSSETKEEPLNQTPLVSVIIVNYNGIEHLPELLDSLKRQDYPNIELIIIDNHSRDDSVAFIKDHYKEAAIIINPTNVEHGAAFNMGLKKARGELILHLDNDIVMEADAISRLVRAAQSRKKWAALAPKLKFYYNRAFINALGNSIHKTDWGSDNFIYYADLGQFDHFTEPFSACFGAVLLNREAIEKVGELDDFYKVYYDDVDWCYRAQINGFHIYNVPLVEFFHKFGGTMKQNNRFHWRKWELVISNRLYFTIKNLERRTLLRFLFNYVFEDIKNALGSLLKGRLRFFLIYMKAYIRFVLAVPRALFKRRRIQKLRDNVTDAMLFIKIVPINPSVSEGGSPRLDVPSICANYINVAK